MNTVTYKCSKCQRYLPVDQFSPAGYRKYGKRPVKYYCMSCERKYKQNKTQEQKILGYPQAKKYRQNNKERVKEYFRKNRELNKRRRADTAKQYRKSHHAEILISVGVRRKRRKECQPKWADVRAIRCKYEEASHLTKETGIRHVVDHIYPLWGKTVCGLHVYENLQVITAEENGKKGNKHPDEFYV